MVRVQRAVHDASISRRSTRHVFADSCSNWFGNHGGTIDARRGVAVAVQCSGYGWRTCCIDSDFCSVSGASFNPIVGIVGALLGEGSWKDTALYAIAQTIGGCTGAVIANVMFDLDAINLSEKVRTGSNIWISEAVASVGLLVVIYGTIRAKRANLVPFTVAAWITGAYFFTSSTSLANPAVTVSRTLSNTFAGIAPESVPMFIVMQLVGAVIGFGIIRFVFDESAA